VAAIRESKFFILLILIKTTSFSVFGYYNRKKSNSQRNSMVATFVKIGYDRRKGGIAMEEQSHDHAYMHAHGIAHHHGHVHENQKAVINRLARAMGHLEKVKRMVEEGYDCSEVLIQLAAVRSALDNTGKVILMDHLRHCMVDAVAAGDEDAIDDLCQAVDKFMK
jgi:DNA-binding FrmR family transcriptional regulator